MDRSALATQMDEGSRVGIESGTRHLQAALLDLEGRAGGGARIQPRRGAAGGAGGEHAHAGRGAAPHADAASAIAAGTGPGGAVPEHARAAAVALAPDADGVRPIAAAGVAAHRRGAVSG